ncbi:PREDICTED: sodium/potassium/calcium exchanger 4-like isoform X2 [Nicrophorus vespilloides]|uniref:Sodium/potassium/calcium exchanger 4-like isoform X2 n=1 Tax=Nicrophorus vespilloides TaxID=110193 RepID=A0ABM1NEX7_NICVS|nr:PREDICTED: sodium/potassium/calcium exchanger 4-like isoform X2 [Nicrophorus vespilloides]
MNIRNPFIILLLVYSGNAVQQEADGASHQVIVASAPSDRHGLVERTGTQHLHMKRVFPIMFGRSLNPNSTFLECSKSIEEFPEFFTEEQRKQGAVILAFVIAIYCFSIIAIICDSYFLPCVERICEHLNLSQDVAAATFMSVATSAPELFVNIIGTFVTRSDIGIGTVVGSSMFNTLGVAAIGGLASKAPIQLDWWPLTRDTVIYVIAIILLVGITWDGLIHWYEAMILFIVYFIYFTIMFNNVRISNFFKRCLKKEVSNDQVTSCIELKTVSCIESTKRYEEQINEPDRNNNPQSEDEADQIETIFKIPTGRWWNKLFFIYNWPIKFMLFITVPDCRKHRRIYPLTFIMCVIWIGLNSYMVSWMITVIGYTLGIQDSILGLTFLAAGGCLPEAISITITSRKGEGAMGVSNALGANTMNILLSLGLPWFIKTTVVGQARAMSVIQIESGSIEYTILALIMVAITLYLTLSCSKFRLSRINGIVLITFYLLFLVLAIVSELVFSNRIECPD